MIPQLGKGFPLEPNDVDALILKLQLEVSNYCYRVYDTWSQQSERTRPCDDITFLLEKKNPLGRNTDFRIFSPYCSQTDFKSTPQI